MIKGGVGGASTMTGLVYEDVVDMPTFLSTLPGYTISGEQIFFHGALVGMTFKKNGFYSEFLDKRGVAWNTIISRKLLPDNCIYVISTNTLYIFEVKHQECEGSVDEKLQTCDFKKKQYIKLLSPISVQVKYCYILNDWFKQERYRDVLDYIKSVGCDYNFGMIPPEQLGLPAPR